MQVKKIMSTNVEVATPDTLLLEAVRRMFKRDSACIFVADDDRLVGIITDRDIALRCVAGVAIVAGTRAKHIMSPQLLYCMDTDLAGDVSRTMEENHLRRLAVFDDTRRLVGIVTLGDMSRHAPILPDSKTEH